MSLFSPAQFSVDLPDATTVAVRLPEGSKEHMFRVSGSAEWSFGFDEDTVTAGDGFVMGADEVYTIGGPVRASVMYVRQDTGGPVSLMWAYLYPRLR